MAPRFLVLLILLVSLLAAQPAPIPTGHLSVLNLVPDGGDPLVMHQPTTSVMVPFRLYVRAPAGMWMMIVPQVSLYVADPANGLAASKLASIESGYSWVRRRTQDDVDAFDALLALQNTPFIDAYGGDLAAPWGRVEAAILHAASGGNTVRHIAFAQLLPAQSDPQYGQLFADHLPIDVEQWSSAQALTAGPDPQVTLVQEAWKGGLWRETTGPDEPKEEYQLFEGRYLAQQLLRLQAPSPAAYAAFMNDVGVDFDGLFEFGLAPQIEFQGFALLQATNQQNPAAATPNQTDDVDGSQGPLVVTATNTVTLRLTLLGGAGEDFGRPWTLVKHPGATLNGTPISPRMGPNGLLMDLRGSSPFSTTLMVNGTPRFATGTYTTAGLVYFPFTGFSLTPGASVSMVRLQNARGALDLNTVSWTAFTVQQF